MLYDPKWEKPADVFSLESLIAWLEKQPADKKYIWAGDNCLLCQYLDAHGRNKYLDYDEFHVDDRVAIVHPVSGDQTFGAALSRARAVLR